MPFSTRIRTRVEMHDLRKLQTSKFKVSLACENFCFENNPLYDSTYLTFKFCDLEFQTGQPS